MQEEKIKITLKKNNMKLIGKNKFLGTIELRTGLHIGDSKESADIGGLDSPVVRRKDNNQPYIPGSSLNN